MKENELTRRKNIKICLYVGDFKLQKASGMGKSISHQKEALRLNNINYTTNPSNQDYQILQVNSQFPKDLIVINRAKKQGKKIIIYSHVTSEDFRETFFFSNLLSPIIRIWLNYFYSKADLLICPTTYTKSLIENYPRLKNKPIRVVSNGVDVNKWINNKVLGDKFKKDYNLKKPVVLSVGLVFPRKGIIDFIRVARDVPKAHFLWVGQYLKNMVKSKGITNELKNKPENFMFTGFIDNLIEAYSAGDIFFFPSYEENEGIVVLEAAAMGKAIIVRDIPVFRSYLKDGLNCLMAKDNEEFVKKINLLLNDSKLRKKISYNARKVASTKSLEKIGKELKNIYIDLVNL